jgi:DNA invertase Pin-like site-specific DNA recombinase
MPESAAAALRIAGYLRVSTEEQALGLSLDSQRQDIYREVAGHEDWELVDIGHDHASGKSLKRRPGLARLLDELDAGELDVLVVSRFDRLTRHVPDFYAMLDRAAKKDWAVVCLAPRLDMTTPEGRLFAGMVALFAQYERELISERQKASVAARRAAGTYTGPRPLVTPAAVARMQALRKEGLSYDKIAARLQLEGLEPLRGDQWIGRSVSKILARERQRQ